MSYRVMVHGVAIECATEDEAISLAETVAQKAATAERRARRASSRSPKDAQPPTPPPGFFDDDEPPSNGASIGATRRKRSWEPPPALAAFYGSLPEQQQAIIKLIATADEEVPLDQIRSALGLELKREASILLAACNRAAKDQDLDWGGIVEYRITGKGEERQSLYTPGPLLRGEEATST